MIQGAREIVSRFKSLREFSANCIEYGLIAALIALAIITGATSFGNALNTKFKAIGTTVSTSGS